MLGPTGSGKSELALVLAAEFGGEIVNYDSVQLHRGLDIGSAKLPLAHRRGISHHLIDVIDADEELTAGTYARLGRALLPEIAQRGAIPVLVGGTGFYLKALLEGLSPAPGRNEEIRARLTALAKRRPKALHRYLRRYDPAAAARIHPNDHQKLIRAAELTTIAQRPVTQMLSQPRRQLDGFSVLKIGLMPERKSLYENLNRRTPRMFEDGLVAETLSLIETGVSPEAKALQSLGYRQAVKVLREGMALEEAICECQTKTRQYAKRQLTWFRGEPGVIWLRGFGKDSEIQQTALASVRGFLAE